MKLSVKVEKEVEAKFIKVSANVRYWDDATINGDQCQSGDNVPFKNGDLWEPVIDIDNGVVIDWPEGVGAKFHFKVCDAGSYYLLDWEFNVLVSIEDNYVPSGLCHGDSGFGDYIIFNVNGKGEIENYSNSINSDDWIDEEA